MNQKQRKMSGEREGLYRRIEDPELIKDCDLREVWERDGNDLRITGRIRGHEVRLFSVSGLEPTSGEIDGKQLAIEDVRMLLEKYKDIARLQTLDAKQSEDLESDSGKAAMRAAELLK